MPKSILSTRRRHSRRCRTSGRRGKLRPPGPAGRERRHRDRRLWPGPASRITIYRTDVDPAIVVRTIAIPDGAAPKRDEFRGTGATPGPPRRRGIYLAGSRRATRRATSAPVPLRRGACRPTRLRAACRATAGSPCGLSVLPPPVSRQGRDQATRSWSPRRTALPWSVRRARPRAAVDARERRGRSAASDSRAARQVRRLPAQGAQQPHDAARAFAVTGQPSGRRHGGRGPGRRARRAARALVAGPQPGRHRRRRRAGHAGPWGRGRPAARVLAGGGLPQGFADGEANALRGWTTATPLRHHDRLRAGGRRRPGARRTTTACCWPATSTGCTAELGRKLRTFVRRGGTLVSLGTDCLMRRCRCRQATGSPARRARAKHRHLRRADPPARRPARHD